MPESFFSENTMEKHEIIEEQLNEAICECLISGYIPELSKFVEKELGYYHSRICKMVRFGYGSVYRPRGDRQVERATSKYYIMSEVVVTEFCLESRFCIPISESIIKKKFSSALKRFENLSLDDIPSKLYDDDTLSSES